MPGRSILTPRGRLRPRALVVPAGVLLVAAAHLSAPLLASDLGDPFALRSQFPLHLLFLEPTPRSARLLARGERRIALRATYENTHAASDALVDLMRADDFATYDGVVTRPLLEAVAAGSPGGTAYFVDGETARVVFDIAYSPAERLEVDVEIPFLIHTGGFLDSIIDEYHETFGLPDGGRPGFQVDRSVSGFVTGTTSVYVEGDRGGARPGDVVLTGRASLLRGGPRGPELSLSISAKLPTGNPDRLDGSGSADFGAALAFSVDRGRSTVHAGYAYSVLGSWDPAPSFHPRNSHSLYATYAFAATGRIGLIGQILHARGPFVARAGSDLGRSTTEIALGLRHRTAGGILYEWAVLENLGQHLNTPDVGAYLGLVLPLGGSASTRGLSP